MRTADDESEVALATYEHFADRDLLSRVVLERMLAGVSTRRYPRTQEPVGEQVEQRARSTSKSSVSRSFVERTRESLAELMSRDLGDMRLAVMMIDGIELKGRTNIVALGITTQGVKVPLGCGKARRRTRPSRPRCSPISSSVALTPSRASCSSSTAARHSARLSVRCSVTSRCSVVSVTKNAT